MVLMLVREGIKGLWFTHCLCLVGCPLTTTHMLWLALMGMTPRCCTSKCTYTCQSPPVVLGWVMCYNSIYNYPINSSAWCKWFHFFIEMHWERLRPSLNASPWFSPTRFLQLCYFTISSTPLQGTSKTVNTMSLSHVWFKADISLHMSSLQWIFLASLTGAINSEAQVLYIFSQHMVSHLLWILMWLSITGSSWFPISPFRIPR